MASLSFEGILKNSETEKSKEESDIFDCVAVALKFGINYSDLGEMNFTILSNILNAFMPKKKKPTQAQIDAIT